VNDHRTGREVRRKILECIRKGTADNGYPPSIRELCEMTGLRSTSSVKSHMEKLKMEGYITSQSGKPRAVSLTEKGQNCFGPKTEAWHNTGIPMAGSVFNGTLKMNGSRNAVFPGSFLRKDQSACAIEVSDDSLEDIGIKKGSVLLIQKQEKVREGDIVIVEDTEQDRIVRYQNGETRPVTGKAVGAFRRL